MATHEIHPDDITIEEMPRPECECGAEATVRVRVDWRCAGFSSVVLEACADCAGHTVQSMRESLSSVAEDSLRGLISNIRMHYEKRCPGVTPGDCLDAIYESAEIARHALPEAAFQRGDKR